MHKISFVKMIASGNDFIVAETRPIFDGCPEKPVTRNPKLLARRICDRKYGVGADGLLLLEKSKIADIGMRVFNADGSEAQMCGNGARCTALYIGQRNVKIETKAGIIESKVTQDNVKIKLTHPRDVKLDIPIKINHRPLKVNFINTGVPHTVIFVEGLDKIDVFNLGRKIRYHKRFMPFGTNVDFVEVLRHNYIKVRTYERGVEDETLACGTGVAASALITVYRLCSTAYRKINVETKSGEILKVYFNKIDNKFTDVWLEGKAKIVYKGEYYV